MKRIYTDNVVYLSQDRWNDWFHYVTMFQLSYVDQAGVSHDLGSVKFGQFNMRDDQSAPELPETFEQLDGRFFSLGQSEEYYQNVKKLKDGKLREELLTALNDVALNLSLFERTLAEDVVRRSLLRDIRENTVRLQFHRIATGGEKLTPFDILYAIPGQAEGSYFRMEFHVVPNSCPPTNSHVVIGRNGVGKTYLFQSMIHCLARGNMDGEYGHFQVESESKLSNFVCVSFSPFDNYPTPDMLEEFDLNRDRYTYIGLGSAASGQDRLAHLEEQFSTAFSTCLKYKGKRTF